MKNGFFYLVALYLVAGLVTFNSCNSDDKNPVGPTITFNTDAGFISSDDTLPIYSGVKIGLTITKGDAALKTIEVLADSIKLDISEFSVNGRPAAANPQLLLGADKDGINNTYEFKGSPTPKRISYTFRVTDDANLSSSSTIKVSFAGTPARITGKDLVVYNYHGPNPGGVDLFRAEVVSGNDPRATIRDYGVVDPRTDGTWVMRFTPLQGSEIKNPSAGVTFAGLTYKEDIAIAWARGSRETGTIDTKKLSKGDFFLVKNGVDFFAVSIDDMVNTPNNNLDNYTISIKR